MKRLRRPAQRLRQAVDCLPAETKRAMLEGIDSNRIIVGSYTDRDGGICPMLAAHRHGGRTSLASFAKAWDRYTGASHRARPATERELRTLRAMLEVSLEWDERGDDLAAVAAELQAAKARRALERAARRRQEAEDRLERRRRRGRRSTGERDRSAELRGRPGWAWLRPFRRLDEYEAALQKLRKAEQELELQRRGADRELEPV